MRRLTSAIVASALLVPQLAAAPAQAAPARQIDYTVYHGHGDFAMGSHPGLRITASRLALRSGVDRGAWTSPWVTPGFALTRLVASWTAVTRDDSRIRVEVRGKSGDTTSSWDTLALWAQDDRWFHRTTQSGQDDDLGSVNVDTWVVPGGVTAYQLRVTLIRAAGQATSPAVSEVGAMASLLPDVSTVRTSRPGVARGIVLDVPRYSQMIHRGEYPQYGGGGEAWCSPTSTSMVLGYYGVLPKPKDYAWVKRSYADPWVDHAARMTYDYDYEGTGNWPFNTAYAANLAGHAFVTRLTSLRPAERSSRPASRWSRRSRSARASSTARRSRRPTGTWWSSSASRRPVTWWSTIPPRPPTPASGAPTTAASSRTPGSRSPAAPCT